MTAIPGFRCGDVAVEGVRLALHRAGPADGGATPALLLHGIPQTALAWRALGPELARDRAVLAPDLKGLGASEIQAPYDVATLTAELAALVLHEVDGPVDVVGHDWGGVLAIALAAGRPELVRRLVVLSAPYRRVDLLHAPSVAVFALPVLPELVLRIAGRWAALAMLRLGWRAEARPDPAAWQAYATAYADPARTRAMLGCYRAAGRPRWGRASQPPAVAAERKLVIWGAVDPVLPVGRIGTAVSADLGPDTTMVTVPSVGHWPHEEAPEVVVPAIADFLRA